MEKKIKFKVYRKGYDQKRSSKINYQKKTVLSKVCLSTQRKKYLKSKNLNCYLYPVATILNIKLYPLTGLNETGQRLHYILVSAAVVHSIEFFVVQEKKEEKPRKEENSSCFFFF